MFSGGDGSGVGSIELCDCAMSAEDRLASWLNISASSARSAADSPSFLRSLRVRGSMLADVALKKRLFAAFMNEAGRKLNILCEVGRLAALTAPYSPDAESCDAGIHGARRCIRPRTYCGIFSAAASA